MQDLRRGESITGNGPTSYFNVDSAPKQEVCLGGSLVETRVADFAWEHGQEAVEFVAVGLCHSTEREELKKESLVL